MSLVEQDVGPGNATPERQTPAQRNVELLDDALSLLPAIVQCKSGLRRTRLRTAASRRKAAGRSLRWRQLADLVAARDEDVSQIARVDLTREFPRR
jgi:hypothetical protein